MSDGPILITGSRGFVGMWLLRELFRVLPGVELVATSAHATDTKLVLDVGDAGAVEAMIARIRPRAVVNLAALSFVPDAEADPEQAYRVNLFGPMHIAQSLLTHVPQCRFLFVGSSEVYGAAFNKCDRPVTESSPLEPMNIYGASKAAADLLMGIYAQQGLQVVRFRPFNHFGPGQSTRFVIPAFVQQIVAAEESGRAAKIRVGNVDSERDFLDVRDVVSAYAAAITRPDPLPPGTVLNLASGEPRSISSILSRLIKLAEIPIEIEHSAERFRAIDVPKAIGDPSRVRELLNWSPTHNFEATLLEVLTTARCGRTSQTDLNQI